MRQPFVATPGGHDGKPAGARPVDEVADQRRLVTKSERIDHAGFGRAAREQRAAKRIRLDGHVDDMFVLGKRFEAMVDGGNRMPGAFDDDIDRRMAHQRQPVVADMGIAGLQRSVERRCLRLLRAPAHARQVRPRRVGRQIGDADQVHPRRARHLGQVHRAELAGADEADPHRPAVCGSFEKFAVQVHEAPTLLMRRPAVRHGADRRRAARWFAARWPASRPARADRPGSR